MKITTCICWIIFSVLASHGGEFDLGAHGTLSVTVPGDWNIKAQPAPGLDGKPKGYLFAITPRSNANAKCMLTLMYSTNGIPNKEAIRAAVLRIGDQFVGGSVEKKKILKEFSLERGYGAYCVFTDASLIGKGVRAGEYKVMGVGEVQPDDNLAGAVTMFADDGDGREFKSMVNIINSLKVTKRDAK